MFILRNAQLLVPTTNPTETSAEPPRNQSPPPVELLPRYRGNALGTRSLQAKPLWVQRHKLPAAKFKGFQYVSWNWSHTPSSRSQNCHCGWLLDSNDPSSRIYEPPCNPEILNHTFSEPPTPNKSSMPACATPRRMTTREHSLDESWVLQPNVVHAGAKIIRKLKCIRFRQSSSHLQGALPILQKQVTNQDWAPRIENSCRWSRDLITLYI